MITIFVEFRVVAGRSRKWAGSRQAVFRRACCAVALRRTAWSEHGMGMGTARARHGHGMASVNQTRPHYVNQMGKTHSKPLTARHGRGTAWAQHGHGMLCVNLHLKCAKLHTQVLRRVSTNKGSDTVFSPKEHKTRSSTQRLERPCAYKSLYKCEPKRRFTHSAYDTLDVKQTV